jgi:hypothetical protein
MPSADHIAAMFTPNTTHVACVALRTNNCTCNPMSKQQTRLAYAAPAGQITMMHSETSSACNSNPPLVHQACNSDLLVEYGDAILHFQPHPQSQNQGHMKPLEHATAVPCSSANGTVSKHWLCCTARPLLVIVTTASTTTVNATANHTQSRALHAYQLPAKARVPGVCLSVVAATAAVAQVKRCAVPTATKR